jgi:hypothetical protein
MSGTVNQLAALASCWFMRRYKFHPASLLNVGVGKTSPELAVWEWLLPDVKLLGIDPRWSPRGYWTKVRGAPQVSIAVGDGTITIAKYCGRCRSLLCTDADHTAKCATVPVSTIDKVAAENSMPPPYFIWMDIDGSELAALRGAKQVLRETGWINIELNMSYGQERIQGITDLLHSSGFVLHYKQSGCDDHLYRRIR